MLSRSDKTVAVQAEPTASDIVFALSVYLAGWALMGAWFCPWLFWDLK